MQKFVQVLEGNLSVKNTPKLSTKYLQNKICKIKQMKNIPVILRTYFILDKNVSEKHNTKEDSSNTTTCKVLSKIRNRENVHSTTFPWLKLL